jgi:hypothetical protein
MSERRNPAFARMISDYVRIRGPRVLPPREVEQLRMYMIDLFRRGEPPPAHGRGLDWRQIAISCGVDEDLMNGARDELRSGFEALRRELRKRPVPISRSRKVAPSPRPAAPVSALAPTSASAPRTPLISDPMPAARRRGRPPAGVVEFPAPTEGAWIDPPAFHEALDLHMRRHGDTPYRLSRALQEKGHWLNTSTLRMWRCGKKAPLHRDSLEVLVCLEKRYGLPPGYFKARLPHPSRATKGLEIPGIGAAERRRLAWHLPDDFDQRPAAEREEILEWVRRVVVSGSTDYRRYQATAMKTRFSIRFPGLQAVRTGIATTVDPDRTRIIAAPEPLASEMADLIGFKTSTLTALGYRRRGVWGPETASQKLEHFGLLFGALAAAPQGPVRGFGLPLEDLTFGLLVMPKVWDWYLRWREKRRGFYTAWEVDMLSIAVALTSAETGWLTQSQHLAQRLRPIPGLLSEAEATTAREDWPATCAALHRFALARAKEIGRVAKVHHDPFEPILPVLEADSPVGEYRKIADEIQRRAPCSARYPKAAAEACRSFLMIRFGLHLGFRQKNFRQLLVCARGDPPRSERQLADAKRGELRWSDRDTGWEVFVPASAFKNSGSSFFGGRPFRLVLPDIGGLYPQIEAYISRHRAVLLGRAEDPGTFFVKTAKASSDVAAYDQNTFYEAWRWIIQRHGIFNPWTGRGAIAGLLPHGPHNVRDVLATHVLKKTGSYEQASYAIQDTPDTVAQHYGRFLPQDKAAMAAAILNRAWVDQT